MKHGVQMLFFMAIRITGDHMNRVKTEIPATLAGSGTGRPCLYGCKKRWSVFSYSYLSGTGFCTNCLRQLEPLNIKEDESCALWQTVPQQSFMVRN